MISNAIVLGSLQSKGFPKPSTNETCIETGWRTSKANWLTRKRNAVSWKPKSASRLNMKSNCNRSPCGKRNWRTPWTSPKIRRQIHWRRKRPNRPSKLRRRPKPNLSKPPCDNHASKLPKCPPRCAWQWRIRFAWHHRSSPRSCKMALLLLHLTRRAVTEVQAHAANHDGRDFQIGCGLMPDEVSAKHDRIRGEKSTQRHRRKVFNNSSFGSFL